MATEPQPRGDRVVVKMLDDSEHAGGIIIPAGVRPYPSRGLVMYVGPGFRKHDGEYMALDLHPGDEVLFFKSTGVELMLADERLLLLRDSDVLMVTEPALQPVER